MKRFLNVVTLALIGTTAASLGSASVAVAGPYDSGPCSGPVRALAAENSYRAVMTSNFKGHPSISTVDIQKPNRFHVSGGPMEMIVIGKKTWMKTNGAWKASPMSMDIGSFINMNPSDLMKHQSGTCVDGGMGMWKGQPARILRAESTSGGLGPSRSTMYVMSDGLVHHVDTSSKSGSMSMDFSNFNGVNISPP